MSEMTFIAGNGFDSCHASCILPLGGGRALCVCFAGSREGADDVGIWLSAREGGAWSAPRRIAKVSGIAHWNPVLFKCVEGVRLVFKVGRDIHSWRSMTMLSRDGGDTWSQPHGYACDPAGGPVRSHPIELANGALLAPCSDEGCRWRPRVDISHDGGETFHRLSDIPIELANSASPCFIAGRGAIQPTLWESMPGHVHALLRTSAGRIFRADSQDSGRTWCTAYPTDMFNNNSGIDIVRDGDGTLYLALNPVRGDFAARTPLCVYKSADGGDSFQPFRTLESMLTDGVTGRAAEFSYPSIAICEGELWVSYTYCRRAIAVWHEKL